MTRKIENGVSVSVEHSQRLMAYSTVVTYIFSFVLFAIILFFPTVFVVSGLYEHYGPATGNFFNVAFACFFVAVSILATGVTYVQSRYFRKKDARSRIRFANTLLIAPLTVIATYGIIKWIQWIFG